MNERPEDADMMKAAWQAQTLDVPRISLELVRHHVDKLNADLREQKIQMYFAIGIMALVVPFGLIRNASTILWVGSLLAVIGALYATREMRRRGSTLNAAGGDVIQTLSAYRGELERRRDYYLHSWRWSLWPMIPSLLVFIVGGALYGTQENSVRHSIWMGVFAVVVISLAIWDHRRRGHALQRELDVFETLNRK